ncbi:MAG: AraC family transcriptional regulator [Victivallaceae bacterium]
MLKCKSWVEKYFDYYVLDFAESGNLKLSMDNSPPVNLTGPVAWLTFPGPHFQFGKLNHEPGSWEHRYVAFSGPFVDELIKRGVLNINLPPVRINNLDRFRVAFDELLKYLDKPVFGPDRAAVMLQGLLLQLHEQTQQEQYDRMDDRLKALVEKMKLAPAENWDFRREARKMELSYSHFRKLFTDGMNKPPALFLTGLKMELAAKLLKEHTLSLTETAEACGYEDIYYFNKSFRKHHSVSPGRYRKQSQLFN